MRQHLKNKLKTVNHNRDEDYSLLLGTGHFTNDTVPERSAHMVIVRSMNAAGYIRKLDTKLAEQMPGILGIYVAENLESLGKFRPGLRFDRPNGEPMFIPPLEILARREVKHVGDAIAAVVAKTLTQAIDAAEKVIVEIDDLPSVTTIEDALSENAVPVWSKVPDNIGFQVSFGDNNAVDSAFAKADHIVETSMVISRVAANPIETRCASGKYDSETGVYTLTGSFQSPFRIRGPLAKDIFGIDPAKLRVITKDVGGSFGMKNGPFPEYALVLWAAKDLDCEVHWTPTRSESFISDTHARDNLTKAKLALDANGQFLALKVKTYANLGAYMHVATPHPPTANVGGLAGVYTTPAITVEVDGVFTHTLPTAPYRGAGRPEATYVIERIIDIAAHELNIDRVELRRRNLIPVDKMPFKTGLTFTYDSGEFEALMDTALEAADWRKFPARKAESHKLGFLRGIGISNPIEIAGGPMKIPHPEFSSLAVSDKGKLNIQIGGHDVGQGHATSFRELARQLLGFAHEDINYFTGDTGSVSQGTGTFGSRTLCAAGTAFVEASEKLIATASLIAAPALKSSLKSIKYDRDNAVFKSLESNSFLRWADIVSLANDPLIAESWVSAESATFPNGCHICEVEVHPGTGFVRILNYVVVDDVGFVLNKKLVEGQIMGGIAQGLGQAVMEKVTYDNENGQLLSGSFQDYAMPRADDLPPITVISRPTQTSSNPLSVKGVGEAGTVGALPAVVNAVIHALEPYRIKHLDMPLSSERIWKAISSAPSKADIGI